MFTKYAKYLVFIFVFLFLVKCVQNCSNKSELSFSKNQNQLIIDSLNNIIKQNIDTINFLKYEIKRLNDLVKFNETLIVKEKERANSIEKVASKSQVIKLETNDPWGY